MLKLWDRVTKTLIWMVVLSFAVFTLIWGSSQMGAKAQAAPGAPTPPLIRDLKLQDDEVLPWITLRAHDFSPEQCDAVILQELRVRREKSK